MFSRNLLKPGTERYQAYYASQPDKKDPDDRFRALPGLLRPGASHYEPVSFAAADASFETIAHLRQIVDGDTAERRVSTGAAGITRFLKTWSIKAGAVSVGVTRLEDYHAYSHVGRGPEYGQPVVLNHDFAIVFAVEMDKEMLDPAPAGPVIMESSRQYLTAGIIALQAAGMIRQLGYCARAHIDGNYRIICPLAARDAGLGEIGRMGLLMTPALGPRVRLSAVTTGLPLIADARRRDGTMIDFCRRCKKCAEVCPARAIPFDDRREIDGARRWQIDSEACFTYWCRTGTDCARCVIACPYAHPDHPLHNLVRLGVRNSALFRETARRLDDLFYGRRPAPKAVPSWIAAAGKCPPP
jgi:ferredoxin